MNYVNAANCIIAYGQLKIVTAPDKDKVIEEVNAILQELHDTFLGKNMSDIPDETVYRRLRKLGNF